MSINEPMNSKFAASLTMSSSLCVRCSGKRWSAASAYLRPALPRPNLTAEVRCMTTKILFDGKRAVGVEYTQKGRTKRVSRNDGRLV